MLTLRKEMEKYCAWQRNWYVHILTGCRAHWLEQKIRNEGEREETRGVKRLYLRKRWVLKIFYFVLGYS